MNENEKITKWKELLTDRVLCCANCGKPINTSNYPEHGDNICLGPSFFEDPVQSLFIPKPVITFSQFKEFFL
jgi:hypothetical protein